MACELGRVAQHLVRLVADGDPDWRQRVGAYGGDVFDQARFAGPDRADDADALRCLERVGEQAFVAAADEFFEGYVEVAAVAGLGDGCERLPSMQYRQELGTGKRVQ